MSVGTFESGQKDDREVTSLQLYCQNHVYSNNSVKRASGSIMHAEIHPLYDSPLVRVSDFRCQEDAGTVCKPEWSRRFYVSFTRKGNFGYKVAGNFHDIHSGAILLENANTEYHVSHAHHVRDECTTFCIAESLLVEMALACADAGRAPLLIHGSAAAFRFPSPVLRSSPELDYLHVLVYRNTLGSAIAEPLKIDLLVVSLLQRVLAHLTDSQQVHLPIALDERSKDLHLETVDRGKAYILNHFQRDINLSDIARHAYASPFHFSRLFKHFTACSPYEYLLQTRLHHAGLLLRNTSSPVTQICFDSGFNSLEHFIATFTRRYGVSPRKYRHLPDC